MKKLLVIIPDLKSGGAEKSLVNFLNEFDTNRFQIDLLLFSHSGIFLSQIPKEVNLLPLDPTLATLFSRSKDELRNVRTRHWFLWLYMRIIKLLGNIVGRMFLRGNDYSGRQFRWKYVYKWAIARNSEYYDVAIAYLEGECSYYLANKVNASRKICWFHTDYHCTGYVSELDEPIFSCIDKIVTISTECVASLKESFPNCSNKIVLLPNITSEKLVKAKSTEFEPEEFSCDHITILSVGRLVSQKGFDLAIEAARIIKACGLDFCWYIIGDGELREELSDKVLELGLEGHFRLLGVKENPYPYIRRCTVLVQPSRIEGKSIVLDEAKILAKPIIVTNYPTVFDQIEDGKTGLIVDLDPTAIANSIIELIHNEDKRNQLSRYLSNHHYGNAETISEYYNLINGEL